MERDAAFWKSFAKRAVQVLFGLLLMVAAFFLSAGTTDLPRAWLFFGIYAVALVFNLAVFLKYNPEVIAARGEIVKPGGMKWWDKAFSVVYTLLIVVIVVVCGLDAGRLHLSSLGIEFLPVGIAVFAAGWSLVSWAMIENKFFECSVRIQKDRGQTVVSKGPYAIVRHPGYAGMTLMYLAMPFGFGSLYGLIPALVLAGAFVFRTHFEDEMLQKELKGYKEYAKKVKYRLLPGVW
ncbi:Phospholipid methyltransferase [uncultured archaeon]|nr:Phospholipid methyltransferase [uncultured archaeon]